MCIDYNCILHYYVLDKDYTIIEQKLTAMMKIIIFGSGQSGGMHGSAVIMAANNR